MNIMTMAISTAIGAAIIGGTIWRRFADGGGISYLHRHRS
jgi:hypothetical protein